MKVYNTNELRNHLKEKGIQIKNNDINNFENNDYFQVINAYKPLFVINVEDLDKILLNIDKNNEIERYLENFSIESYQNNQELKDKIISKICLKYGIKNDKDAIKRIKEINYIHHIYDQKCEYNDFLRMFQFEHELRNILLKILS